jgi:hypothetical protein
VTTPHAPGRANAAALALSTLLLLSVAGPPAWADRDGRRGAHERRDDGGRHDRGRHGGERERERHHHYATYAPPPVYYPRHESPGISIFFPIEIH